MVHAEYQFHLPVTPEEAFAVLGDPSRDEEWQASVVRSTLLDAPARAGSRYEITFHMFGRDLDFVARITDYVEGVRSGYTTESGPFSYTGGYTYTPAAGGGTDVMWSFDVEPGKFFGLLPLSFMRWVLVSQVEKDTRTLRARLEEHLQETGRG
jgi:hypothetical protein